MKIEAGKYYRMRNGWKAYIAAIYNGELPQQPEPYREVIGWCYDPDSPGLDNLSWCVDGSYIPGSKADIDLIAPWEEPRETVVFSGGEGEAAQFNGEYTLSTKPSQELSALSAAYEALYKLDDDAAHRVLDWLVSKFGWEG